MKIIATKPRRNISRKKCDRSFAIEVSAVICAVICAVCLIGWSAADNFSADSAEIAVAASITHTAPQKLGPKGFWDYFSEAMAEAVSSILGLDS